MTELTVERLFADPPLTGTVPSQLKFSPDGKFVTFLRAALDDRERLDLWRHDIATGETECWLNSKDLVAEAVTLTAAEKAERERKRIFSKGITHYEFRPGGDFSPAGDQLLIPADGAGYLLDVASGALNRFTPPDTRQTDFRFSPQGRFISYVRANDLFYYEVATGRESRVTEDGSETIANGIADFIAAEEMHRFDGHWWSPDEQYLAFTRVDEATVAISQRYEIDADSFNVIEQRYPFAGAANAQVRLRVLDRAEACVREIDFQHKAEDYLARVAWSGSEIVVQVQSREQTELSLDFHDPRNGTSRTALSETSATWLNLHDNFKPLDADRFLWTSQRDGHSHIYLYWNGEPQQLTSGVGEVNEIVHANAERVLFTGWLDSPVEQHLYGVATSGGTPVRLTESGGWHEAIVDRDGTRYLDRVSSLTDPGRVLLCSADIDAPRAEASAKRTEVAAQPLNSDHPYFPYLSTHSTQKLGTLQAADGQTLHYRLTPPSQVGRDHSLVVYVYGGPGVQRVKDEWAPLMLQLFAQRGIGVLELDNRGSSNRGTAFEAPIHRAMGSVEVHDQVVAAQFAQSLDWVDPARIGVFGHSYGGYMTLMCLARAPEVFAAGVSVAPVSQWELYDTHYTERYLATPQDNPEGYARSAVFPYLDQLRGKLLIMHGMADDNVLFTHSTKLFKALQDLNVQFEMMTYPGSKHALQEKAVSIHRFNLILNFFERTL